MPKNILNVGQCGYDHQTIQNFIQKHFVATVSQANSHSETLSMAQQNSWDLILVNRVFDADGGSGLELIKSLKADPVTRSHPVMLVSNFHDAQLTAVEAGALPGFGKASLDTAATLAELRKVLG
jgi:two-component system, chemotaxis family, chemotaxis protein CheY